MNVKQFKSEYDSIIFKKKDIFLCKLDHLRYVTLDFAFNAAHIDLVTKQRYKTSHCRWQLWCDRG